jgi:hypothetical protein
LGSFNTTCFASQQTIAPGDECYVWPIIQQSGYTPVELVHKEETHAVHAVTYSTCHPNRFWTPYGCLIAAKYDDYGSVALTDTPLNRQRIFHLLCSLYAQNLVVREGENKSHDVAFDFRSEAAKLAPNLLSHLDRFKRSGSPMMVALAELPLEVLQEDHAFPELVELWNAMWHVSQEHRLFGISTLQFLRPVQFAVMHRAAYDRLIALAEEGRSWNRSSLVRRPFLQSALAQAREDRNTFMLKHATLDKLDLMASIMYKDWLREHLSAAGTISGVFYYQEALELAGITTAEEPGSAEEQQLIERLVLALDMRYVLEGLSRLNLHLGPIVYAEQDYSNAIGQDYAAFVQGISEKITRQRRYDDDADE